MCVFLKNYQGGGEIIFDELGEVGWKNEKMDSKRFLQYALTYLNSGVKIFQNIGEREGKIIFRENIHPMSHLIKIFPSLILSLQFFCTASFPIITFQEIFCILKAQNFTEIFSRIFIL